MLKSKSNIIPNNNLRTNETREQTNKTPYRNETTKETQTSTLSYLYIHVHPLPLATLKESKTQKIHPKTTHSPTPVPTQMPATFMTATLSPARAARVNRDALPRRLVDMFENTSFCGIPN